MNIVQRIKEEPALVVALLAAALSVAAAFGFNLTDAQQDAVLAMAALLVGSGVVTRQFVVPEAKRLRKQRERR